MRLVLGTFARGGIEAISGGDLSDGVRAALRRYATRERSGWAKRVDRHCLRRPGATGPGMELTVDPKTERALERRAREYGGVAVEELAAHAVLVYLAEADASAGD